MSKLPIFALLVWQLLIISVNGIVFPFLQTTPNFLAIAWNSTLVLYNEQNIPLTVAQVQPTVGLYNANLCNQTYLLLFVDPDVGGDPNTAAILHGVRANLTCARTNNITVAGQTIYVLNSTSPVTAPYIPPSPPAGVTHRYTMILFRQSANYTIPAAYQAALPLNASDRSNRRNFNTSGFSLSLGYTSNVAAGVFNGTGASNTTNATTTSSSTLIITTPNPTAISTAGVGSNATRPTTSGAPAATFTGVASRPDNLYKSVGTLVFEFALGALFFF